MRQHAISPGQSSSAFWTCALLALLSSLISAGFSLAGLVGMRSYNVFAWYAASRSIALPLAILLAISFRSRQGVLALALTMTLVQLFDSLIGFGLHIPAKSYGPLLFALLGFATALRLHRQPSSHP